MRLSMEASRQTRLHVHRGTLVSAALNRGVSPDAALCCAAYLECEGSLKLRQQLSSHTRLPFGCGLRPLALEAPLSGAAPILWRRPGH